MYKYILELLTTKSFEECGGLEEFPNLLNGGIVCAVAPYPRLKRVSRELLEKELIRTAIKMRYTHIFEVEFFPARSDEVTQENMVSIRGKGYKPTFEMGPTLWEAIKEMYKKEEIKEED